MSSTWRSYTAAEKLTDPICRSSRLRRSWPWVWRHIGRRRLPGLWWCGQLKV